MGEQKGREKIIVGISYLEEMKNLGEYHWLVRELRLDAGGSKNTFD